MNTGLGSYLCGNSEASREDRQVDIATEHDALHGNTPEGHLIQPGERGTQEYVTKETTPEQHLKDA